jgi:GrpB-like predicted nucleotidyltransferase (UPF0157 family)
MGARDTHDTAAYDAAVAAVTIGGPRPLSAPIEVRDCDPAWPAAYAREATRITAALGARMRRIEHVGSTSVPGLPAKPIIDIVLEVNDSADESAYVPDLESVGYELRIREPEWFEHRMLKAPGDSVNLHVFSAACPETERMVRFRDHLRASADDRDLYARTKRELAAREWKYMQQYADAKTEVIGEIMARALAPSADLMFRDVSATAARPSPRFELQFPIGEVPALASRFPVMDDGPGLTVGIAVRARGHYTRAEFIEVCAWKTARSRPKVAANSEPAVVDATRRALTADDEARRISALLELEGVGVPTASTLLYFVFPEAYPILDVRALESLGVKPRSGYPVSFWLAYLSACRTLARRAGVSIRTLDKALWQHSKERNRG